MAEPPDDLKELKLKVVELENQLREFVDPPELTEDEIKAYKKVKAAVEFGARGCGGYPCMAAAMCGRGCYMAEQGAVGCGGRGCSQSCYMAEAAAAVPCGGRGCSCYAAEPSAVACRGCSCACYEASAMACRGCSCSCYAAEPSAVACGGRGCSGPCIAGHGTPGPKIGRGAVGRFASLAD